MGDSQAEQEVKVAYSVVVSLNGCILSWYTYNFYINYGDSIVVLSFATVWCCMVVVIDVFTHNVCFRATFSGNWRCCRMLEHPWALSLFWWKSWTRYRDPETFSSLQLPHNVCFKCGFTFLSGAYESHFIFSIVTYRMLRRCQRTTAGYQVQCDTLTALVPIISWDTNLSVMTKYTFLHICAYSL